MRIPGVMLGILFFWADPGHAGGALQLSEELSAEGNWRAAGREARRVLAGDPSNERASLLSSISALRVDAQAGRLAVTNDRTAVAVADLARLATSAGSGAVRAEAAYEGGLALYRQRRWDEAYPLLRDAFLKAGEGVRLACASYGLDRILRERPELEPMTSGLRVQVDGCRALWTRDVQVAFDGAGPTQPRTRLFAWPGVWIVAFYRHAVGPALGNRCSLTPSCSRYFAAASRAHGLLAFPIVADRLVREPGVVAAGEYPIIVGGHVRYADPLQAHDWWLGGGRR